MITNTSDGTAPTLPGITLTDIIPLEEPRTEVVSAELLEERDGFISRIDQAFRDIDAHLTLNDRASGLGKGKARITIAIEVTAEGLHRSVKADLSIAYPKQKMGESFLLSGMSQGGSIVVGEVDL